jgi:hypothetical protein
MSKDKLINIDYAFSIPKGDFGQDVRLTIFPTYKPGLKFRPIYKLTMSLSDASQLMRTLAREMLRVQAEVNEGIEKVRDALGGKP